VRDTHRSSSSFLAVPPCPTRAGWCIVTGPSPSDALDEWTPTPYQKHLPSQDGEASTSHAGTATASPKRCGQKASCVNATTSSSNKPQIRSRNRFGHQLPCAGRKLFSVLVSHDHMLRPIPSPSHRGPPPSARPTHTPISDNAYSSAGAHMCLIDTCGRCCDVS
jgi:hypothetical protein